MRRTAWCAVLAALCLAIPSLARAGLALARAADLAGLRPRPDRGSLPDRPAPRRHDRGLDRAARRAVAAADARALARRLPGGASLARRAGLLPALRRRDRGLATSSRTTTCVRTIWCSSTPPIPRWSRRCSRPTRWPGSWRPRSPARCSRPGCRRGSRGARPRSRRGALADRAGALLCADPRRARHARDARPPPAESRRSQRAPRTAWPTRSPARGS